MYLKDQIQYVIDREGYALVSIVGAGGKTTTLYGLAESFKNELPVLITTTTMMFKPDVSAFNIYYDGQVSYSKKSHKVDALFSKVSEIDSEKVIGISSEKLDAMVNDWHYKLILNEADGAKRKPLKAYASHEPVIPTLTNIVIIVFGLDGLFQLLDDANVHRKEIFSEIAGLKIGEEIKPIHLINGFNHANGFLKNIPKSARIYVLLNKFSLLKQTIDFESFAKEIFSKSEFIEGVIVSEIMESKELYVFKRSI